MATMAKFKKRKVAAIMALALSLFTFSSSSAQELTLRTPHFAIGLLSNTDSIKGLQIGLFSNFANKMNGVQLAPLTNACTTELRGMQLSGVDRKSVV